MVKVTFTLDDETVSRLRATAARLGMAQSRVVREAVEEYSARIGRLGESERRQLLATFDRVVPGIPARPLADVEAELKGLREARRGGGRRSARRKRRT
jgi:hypothetical protein